MPFHFRRNPEPSPPEALPLARGGRRRGGFLPLVALAALLLPAGGVWGQAASGFPVTDAEVIRSCGSCHAVDDDGMMGRVSFMRKTPEGWQSSIRRMVMLHGVTLEPEVAREVVRYLATQHGVAPAELEPGRFDVERRLIRWTYGDPEVHNTCSACHSMGKVITQRRTREEWELLMETHRGLYPLVDRQRFQRMGPAPRGADADPRHPVERAVDHLAAAYPLNTAEWAAWRANLRAPALDGSWTVTGHDPARGPVHGRVEVTAVPGRDDEFTTRTTLHFPADGGRVDWSGRGVVYTGFQWRGRSGADGEFREVLTVDRGWEEMSGRWFTGAHDELGMDVTLRRVGVAPQVAGVHPATLRTGAQGQELRILGANFPDGLSAAQVDFGPGVHLREVQSRSSEEIQVRVDVDGSAPVGRRDLRVAGASREGAALVYDRVDGIRVLPAEGMARVGGTVMPARFQQFEAVAFHNGPDGRPGTDDDLILGRVDAEWSLEEFHATYEDDDLRFVGEIDGNGFFTPGSDGPNPERHQETTNFGDVWVVASYLPPGSPAGAAPLRARAHLLVSVPIYMEWDYWPERPLEATPDRAAPAAGMLP